MRAMGWQPGNDWHGAVASALEWWRDAGVDALVEDEPRDWLARRPPAPAGVPATDTVAEAPAEILPDDLGEFIAWRMGVTAPEAGWMQPVVPPSGEPGAWMILTDMPEEGDERVGVLLGGAAGRLFDRMLAAIGQTRESVYIASVAVARPVTGQIAVDEQDRLFALARHHVKLANPSRLLLLGDTTKRVFDTTEGSAFGNGGRGINLYGRNTMILAIRHPRFLLGKPAAKASVWNQLMQFCRGTSL